MLVNFFFSHTSCFAITLPPRQWARGESLKKKKKKRQQWCAPPFDKKGHLGLATPTLLAHTENAVNSPSFSVTQEQAPPPLENLGKNKCALHHFGSVVLGGAGRRWRHPLSQQS